MTCASWEPPWRCRQARASLSNGCDPGSVGQAAAQPLLHPVHGLPLAPRQVLYLVLGHATHAEVLALGVREVEPTHGRGRAHGQAFGQRDARVPLRIEQAEELGLLGVVWAGGVARRGADAL